MLPFNIGPGEVILFLIIALVVLGPGKLPDVASSLGKSVREFRKAATDITDATKLDAPANAATPAPSATAPAPALAPTTVAPSPPPTDQAEPSSADTVPAEGPEAEAAPAGSPARDPN